MHANHHCFLGDGEGKRNGNAEKGVVRPDVDHELGERHTNSIGLCFPERQGLKYKTEALAAITLNWLISAKAFYTYRLKKAIIIP